MGTHVEETALSADGELAIRGGSTLEIRSSRTGALIRGIVLPRAMPLIGYARGVAALDDGRTILILRTSDGARAEVRIPVRPAVGAAFTPSGLFYAYGTAGRFKGRIAYVPLHELAKRLR